MKPFPEVSVQSIDQREKEILQFWKDNQTFTRSVQDRSQGSLFTFYDGPPFATGLPHYGHILAGTIKDVVLRYKTMKGFYAPRRFGWDCHGLPVENEIEKEYQLSGKHSIEQFGIARFNEACRSIVLRYTGEWQGIVERMGRWVDFGNTYRTMDRSFMESVWWVFKQLYEKGLVYEGLKVMPFSTKLGTPLSNFEASENYREVDDPSVIVAFPSRDEENLFFLAWTTTPWTLPSNLALMVGPRIEYAEVWEKKSDRRFILASERIVACFKDPEEYRILRVFPGYELEGKSYLPLFDFFADRRLQGCFRILLEESVSVEEGTGIVHAAPAFGEVDFYACQKVGIDPVCPVDQNGRFTEEVFPWKGVGIKEAEKEILRSLKEQQLLFHHATCRHRYPFCPRSDTPLIYRTVCTWFVAVEKIKEQILQVNEQIHWVPDHIQYGRFGKWLLGARDWAISRNRYWGTPIPIWRADDGELLVIGSLQELKERSGREMSDLHRHFLDEVEIVHHGKVFRRVPEVFDCWFESGSMPYAQNHYPFENKELFEKNFPAQFIAEGLDQTRGWFYTLTVLSAALFQKPAFQNVIVNGLILAADGAKMSKRLKNYPDPMDVVKQYGADAIRLYMLHSPAVKAEDLAFSKQGVEGVLRQILLPLWNAHLFLMTYARIYSWQPPEDILQEGCRMASQPIDRWILSLLHQLISHVEQGMEEYELAKAVEPLVVFVDQLTNWYIRRSRRRFWSEENRADRTEAFSTLYICLMRFVALAAPLIPFMSEAIYRNLRIPGMEESVHLLHFPSYLAHVRDEGLEAEMEAVQRLVSLGHSLRKEQKVKVRQPLSAAYIVCSDEKICAFLQHQSHLVEEELNVRKLLFSQDESAFVEFKAKPQFKILGKKVGRHMRALQAAIESFGRREVDRLLSGHAVVVEIEGEPIVLTGEDVQIERMVKEGVVAANQGNLTIGLDVQLNEDLWEEGVAREIVNKVNTMRKEAGLAVTDRIRLYIDTSARARKAILRFHAFLSEEVLAKEIGWTPEVHLDCVGEGEWDLNGETARILIHRFS